MSDNILSWFTLAVGWAKLAKDSVAIDVEDEKSRTVKKKSGGK